MTATPSANLAVKSMTLPSFLASPEAECSICGVVEESPRRRCSRRDCWERSACSSSLTSSSSLAQCYQMAKFDPFLSLDCARVEGVGAQSQERKGSNFAA